MRWTMAVMSLVVLAGCATRPPATRVIAHPHRPAQHPTASAKPSQSPNPSTPVKLEAPTRPPEGPGSNVPLEGFRPMRNQSRSGA
jgi:hypothetical protein